MELIGWIGSMLLAFCALPQAIESCINKSSKGVSWGLLSMWGIGEVLTLVYVLPRNEIPLIANYSLNILFLIIILYYKIWPEEN